MESFETAHPATLPTSRALPHSLESEEMLLSCCMMDPVSVIPNATLAGLTPASFYEPKHGIVFECLLAMLATGKPIEVYAVAEELRASKKLDAIGGVPFLLQITAGGGNGHSVPTTIQAAYFMEKVRERATLRELIRCATGLVEDAYNYSGGMDDFLASAASKLATVTAKGIIENEDSIQHVAAEIEADFSRAPAERESSTNLVSWGLTDVDRFCGKLTPGSLNILAGMPSTGKSALADRVAWNTAHGKRNVLMFTYEMTKRDKAIRIAQQEARVNFAKFDEVPIDMKIRFTRAVQAIRGCSHLHVYEKDKTINRLVGRCRMFAQRAPIGLIVVDFLQYLARLEPTIGRERTDEKIGRLTAELKSIAVDCKCPVLLLSSINRSEYKDGNRPSMSGLKGSGEIESDADTIGILHWPKKTPDGCDQDPHDERSQFYVEFNQEKGRNNGVHTVGLTFQRDVTLFQNYVA